MILIERFSLNSNDVLSHCLRGNIHSEDGSFGQAIDDFSDAIRLFPHNSGPFCELAWILATCPESRYRDGAKAVEYAKKGGDLDEWKGRQCWIVLAAAHAESGNFDEAIDSQRRAIALADDTEKEHEAERLGLYESHLPYRAEPKKREATSGGQPPGGVDE